MFVSGGVVFLTCIFSGKVSGNKQFASDVAAWAFQESLALRIDEVKHHRVNETEPGETYTINDNVVCHATPDNAWSSELTHETAGVLTTCLQV